MSGTLIIPFQVPLPQVLPTIEGNIDYREFRDQLLRISQLLLQSGLAPDDFFEKPRKARAAIEGVNFYVCQLKQPLDDRWAAWPGRHSGQEAWPAYIARWGVLAPSEAEARQIALDQQKECFPLPAEVIDCSLNGEGYTDSPGVVWQGIREPMIDGGEAS